MSDQKISELTAITGANTADDDLLVIVDTSTGETKKITKAELTTTINNALIDGAPATLDTLNELAAALADDANFASTVTNSLAGKVDTTGGTMSGNLAFGDNNKAIFGAGSDLQIYHTGAHSYIDDAGTGNLYLNSNGSGTIITGAAGTQAQFFTNGAVNLFYNDSPKLATTSTGIDVTGTATMDGLTVDTAIDTSGITLNTPYGVAGEQYAAIRWNNSSFAGGDSEIRNVVDGTASVGSSLEFHTEQTGTGTLTERLKLHNNGDISFYEDTGTTAKFFWDASAESLGIGTSTVDSLLHLYKSDATSYNAAATDGQVGVGPTIYLENPANSNASVGGQIVFGMRSTEEQARIGATGGTAPALTFGTADAERMRITSTGNVGIGTASPASQLELSKATGSATVSPIELEINTTTSASDWSTTTAWGRLKFTSDDPSATYERAAIAVIAETIGGGNSSMLFETMDTERMRLDSSGNLLVGTTSNNPTNGYELVRGNPTGTYHINATSTSIAWNHYAFKIGANTVGTITTSGSSTAYNTSSDYRLKEDWQPMVNASTRVEALKPVNFAWKADGSRVDGFLAHELAEVIPEAVTGEKDAVDDEGNPVYQGIDQSKIVPLLTASLQEALARITTLEVEVAALKGN